MYLINVKNFGASISGEYEDGRNKLFISLDGISDKIKLFKETPKLKVFKPAQSSANSATFGYEGDVKDLKIYVPKYEEVKLRPCPKPPLKCFVINEVLIELEKKEK